MSFVFCIHSATLCLSIEMFSPFTFIDRYVLIAILFIVWGLFCSSFFPFFPTFAFFLWFDDYIYCYDWIPLSFCVFIINSWFMITILSCWSLKFKCILTILNFYSLPHLLCLWVFFFVFVCLFVFCLFRDAPMAYGSSQARGGIGAAATSLRQSNVGSKLCLQPTPPLTATSDP